MKEHQMVKPERLNLDEILELCADYERQIEEEQKDVKNSPSHQEGGVKMRPKETFVATASVEVMQAPNLVLSSQEKWPQKEVSPVTTPLSPGHASALTPNR